MNSTYEDRWDLYRDKQDLWRWRRTAKNGEIVGSSSQGYKHAADCRNNAMRNGMSEKDVPHWGAADE